MDPRIWRKLPLELVHLIFARLPVAGIVRLKVLSKHWYWNVAARRSAFRRVCAQTNAKMIAVTVRGEEPGEFAIRLYDIKASQWHCYFLSGLAEKPYHAMGAIDGGLVCYISRSTFKDEDPLVINVCNPLTREWKQIPLDGTGLSTVQPRMVQLVMDQATKAYRVIVVNGPVKQPYARTVASEIFHSDTGRWSSQHSANDIIFGECYEWLGLDDDDDDYDEPYLEGWLDYNMLGPCILDTATNQFQVLDDDSYPGERRTVVDFIALKDKLFVLDGLRRNDEELYEYVITEYQGRRSKPHWVKLRDHKFTEDTHNFYSKLYACEGFLLVIGGKDETNNPRPQYGPVLDLAHLCDLSNGKWHNIPAMRQYMDSDAVMCEARWDALP